VFHGAAFLSWKQSLNFKEHGCQEDNRKNTFIICVCTFWCRMVQSTVASLLFCLDSHCAWRYHIVFWFLVVRKQIEYYLNWNTLGCINAEKKISDKLLTVYFDTVSILKWAAKLNWNWSRACLTLQISCNL